MEEIKQVLRCVRLRDGERKESVLCRQDDVFVFAGAAAGQFVLYPSPSIRQELVHQYAASLL